MGDILRWWMLNKGCCNTGVTVCVTLDTGTAVPCYLDGRNQHSHFTTNCHIQLLTLLFCPFIRVAFNYIFNSHMAIKLGKLLSWFYIIILITNLIFCCVKAFTFLDCVFCYCSQHFKLELFSQ